MYKQQVALCKASMRQHTSKKIYKLAALAAITLTPASYASDLTLTGVIDGPLTGGVPKAVQVYVSSNISDLSRCGIGSANNGQGSDGQEFTFPSVSASEGDYLYIASESQFFNQFFGFSPNFVSGAANINGDDAIELFCDGNVVDTFGDINVDGSNQAWEYLDGWASRKAETSADGSQFVIANWNFSGKNALDGETTNDTAATPFPVSGGGSGDDSG